MHASCAPLPLLAPLTKGNCAVSMLNTWQLFVIKVDVLQFLWGKLMGIPDWHGRF